MTQEEKAKAYNEALERASKLRFQNPFDTVSQMVEYIFPELKESEDERIRKEIISHLQHEYVVKRYVSDVEYDRWIAWLEKQGDKSVNIDIESMVSSYKQRLKSQGGVENAPLVNMCLTAFRHGVENVLEELNLEKLEKQGGQHE